MVGALDEREPVLLEDPIERRYAVREMRVRVHQARFRGRVIPAYQSQCTMCRLKEVRLLDAAHITSDADLLGEPAVPNGLSLCAIHHRAFDKSLVAVIDARVSNRGLAEAPDGRGWPDAHAPPRLRRRRDRSSRAAVAPAGSQAIGSPL